ncbi:hypothetical protein Scep_007324 [Stephania cephalantha]|uniref:Transposase-associated domain-containing protein n=1 Tax=Stephania cephalantha TaxID=152367 RepID=A0AAP0PLP3_9MAGN
MTRVSKESIDGVRAFMNWVQVNEGNPKKNRCPSGECRNVKRVNYDSIYEHLITNGWDPTNTTWFLHGQKGSSDAPSDDVESSNSSDG